MKTILILFIIIGFLAGCKNEKPVEPWYSKTFYTKGLKERFLIDSSLTPRYLEADFNGDKLLDYACLIRDKQSNKKGLLIIHNKTQDYFFFGAGKDFGNGGEDFKWIDKWSIYNLPSASETQFNEETLDIPGSKEIPLKYSGILLAQYQDGDLLAGGIIYWTGTKYIWIHQGE